MAITRTFAAAVTLTLLDEYDAASITNQFTESIEVALLRVPGVLTVEVVYSGEVVDDNNLPDPTETENADADHQPTSPK